MNHKAKHYELERRLKMQQLLAARIALLEERGMKPEEWVKEAYIRKLKADIRKTGSRLRSINASEQLVARKIQLKQEKAVAEKEARENRGSKPEKVKTAKPPRKEKKAKEKPPASEDQE